MPPTTPATTRRRVGGSVLLAFVLAGSASVAVAGGSDADRGADAEQWRTLELTGTSAGEDFVDVGPPGPSLGDAQVFSEDLHRRGATVGQYHVLCTITRADTQTRAFTAQCTGTASLPGGQIATQGLVTSAQLEREPFDQAITGGTGAYRRARGEAVIDEAGPQPARFTFRVQR